MFSRVLKSSIAINLARNYSYKAIKRPTINATTNKAFVEKKLKEYDLAKVLRSQIEISGPITGKLNTSD
jgi:hypothetical protein